MEYLSSKSLILDRNGEKDGFGERFGRVIPNGSVLLLEGEEGAGKSIFSQRFCYSFLKQGITCSYISTQYTIKSFLRQTASIGYDTREYLMHGKLFFISTEVMLAETKEKHTYLDKFITTKKIFDPEIIFIDSFSCLLNESLNADNIIELKSFFNRLKGSGKIMFLTINPNEWDEQFNREFVVYSDIHFRVSRESMPGVGLVNNIYINKFNGAHHRYEPITRFSVQPGYGLTIETSGVAF